MGGGQAPSHRGGGRGRGAWPPSLKREGRSGRKLRKEQRGLTSSRLRRIRPMNHVAPSLHRKIPPNRPRRSLQRISGPNHLPSSPNRLKPLKHHSHQRPRGDELHKLPKERPRSMLGIVPFSKRPLNSHMAQSHKAKSLTLKASNDLASKRASKGIRLHEDQSTVHGFLFSRGPAARTRRSISSKARRTKRGLRWAQRWDAREQQGHVPAGRRPAGEKQARTQPRKAAPQRRP